MQQPDGTQQEDGTQQVKHEYCRDSLSDMPVYMFAIAVEDPLAAINDLKTN